MYCSFPYRCLIYLFYNVIRRAFTDPIERRFLQFERSNYQIGKQTPFDWCLLRTCYKSPSMNLNSALLVEKKFTDGARNNNISVNLSISSEFSVQLRGWDNTNNNRTPCGYLLSHSRRLYHFDPNGPLTGTFST